MIRKRHHYLPILVCLLSLSACGKEESASQDQAAKASAEADVTGVALDATEQTKLGVATAPLAAAQYQGEVDGPGTVLAVQPIAQMMADLKTTEAAADASAAALTRAQGLFDAGTAISQEALQSAKRQAVADEASRALAKTKAAVAFGSDAPWLDTKRRETILRKLTSGSAAIVKASFPSGFGNAALTQLTIRKVGAAPTGHSWHATDVWTGPADPNVPGPTLFGYVDSAQGLAQGDHVIAAIATADKLDGVIVPASAVVIAGGQAWCYTVDNGDHFTRVPIELDQPSGDGYFQPGGPSTALKAGSDIVVGGAGLLLARETGGGEEED